MENAEHTHFVCARWGAEREAVGRAVGAQLTPDTMFSLMPQSEQISMLIESFVTLVMKTRELDGRATTGASRNRIEACTCGLASSTDLAVRVVQGRNRFILPLYVPTSGIEISKCKLLVKIKVCERSHPTYI